MPILNYTTSIDASKSIAEIQGMLARADVSDVHVSFRNQEPVSIRFIFNGKTYRLPCRAEAVYALISTNSAVPKGLRTHKQALRIAWRILKDWTAAQLAIIQAEMVTVDEVFLPYMIVTTDTETGKEETVYAVYKQNQKLIEQRP